MLKFSFVLSLIINMITNSAYLMHQYPALKILICFVFLIGYTINLIGFSNLGGKNELDLFSINFELQIGRSHKQQ